MKRNALRPLPSDNNRITKTAPLPKPRMFYERGGTALHSISSASQMSDELKIHPDLLVAVIIRLTSPSQPINVGTRVSFKAPN